MCNGVMAAGGTALNGTEAWPEGVAGSASTAAGTVGATGGFGGGASLPLFNTQIPTRTLEIRFFGRQSSSRSSI